MSIRNTTLDDISAVIGFTATLRLSAWFGDGNNLYVPAKVVPESVLVKLIGEPAAKAMSNEWGGTTLAIPRLRSFEEDHRRQFIARMLERGFGTREVATQLRMSERRVQQIMRELELAGLINPVSRPKKFSLEIAQENTQEKS
jgi:hypothetical protein